MNNLRQHIFFIEEIIQKMGIDFAPRRIKKDSIEWEFHRSESRILMFLRDGLSKSEDKREILVITSPVMAVPDENIDPTLIYVVFPNRPERSVMHFRMQSTNEATRMPLIGRTLVHEEGVQLIEDWINSLTNNCN